jgi:hypothetical protein
MYSRFPTFVLAFHGCDKEVRDRVLLNKERLLPSQNEYDWLGHGIYFWENNYQRAYEYAEAIHQNQGKCKTRISHPAVIGVVIDLGNCLNLLDSRYIEIVKQGYDLLNIASEKAGFLLPENKPLKAGRELIIRNLDCAVIQTIHASNEKGAQESFDTVRGIFEEGEQLYPGAGFKKKTHIQICVRNPNCIKGYFHPLKQIDGYKIP